MIEGTSNSPSQNQEHCRGIINYGVNMGTGIPNDGVKDTNSTSPMRILILYVLYRHSTTFVEPTFFVYLLQFRPGIFSSGKVHCVFCCEQCCSSSAVTCHR